jgi:Skp family chaperone for outer membrane proteins
MRTRTRRFLVLLATILIPVTLAPAARGATADVESLREELQKTQAAFQKLLDIQQQTQRKMEELQRKLEAIEAA